MSAGLSLLSASASPWLSARTAAPSAISLDRRFAGRLR
jgi:hypothetical protein